MSEQNSAPTLPTPADIGAPVTPEVPIDEPVTPEEEAELASSETEQKPKEESKPAVVKHKLKIDGQEVELTEEEMKKYASLGKASQKRMQEAAEARKEYDKLRQDVGVFLQMLQKNPAKALADIGIDPEKFSEEFLNQKLEEQQKTPEQKEKEKLLKDLEEAQKKIKEVEEAKKKEEEERLTNEAASKIERDINEAIEGGGMPKSPLLIRKVADLLMLAGAQGVDLEAKDVIPIAKKQYLEEWRELMRVSPEDFIEEMIGEDKVKNIRRKYIKKLKEAPVTPSSIKPTGQDVQEKKETVKKPIKSKDFFKGLGSF